MNGGENDVTVSYTYNADGIRTGKTVTTEVYITHVHSYTVSEIVMPTCTQGGYKLYVCSCGDQYTDQMAALGHDFRADSGLIPTTTCRRCGASRVPTLTIEPPGDTIILGEGSGAEIMSVSAESERILVSTVLTEYEYVYTGAQLTQMIVTTTVDDQSPTTQTLYFTYETGGPMTVTCNGITYYYAANLQGDIIAILDADGEAVVQYTYDAWGNILDISGELATTLGETNPLTYRGYVYDHETQLYYCQSRYYDPETGRWLNADAFTSTGQGFIGNNMFAYCGNNPVNQYDPSGYCVFSGGGLKNNFANACKCTSCGHVSGGGVSAYMLAGISAGIAAIGMAAWNYTVEFLSTLVTQGEQILLYALPREDRIARAEAEIFRTVRQDSSVRYWTATVQRGYVDIGRPLTFNQAVREVCAGRSVFAVTWYEAKAVAIAAGGRSGHNNKSLYPEIDSGKEGMPGYYYHYHTYDRSGGHVYFLFGEA